MTKWERLGIVFLFLGTICLLMNGLADTGNAYLAFAIFSIGTLLVIWREND